MSKLKQELISPTKEEIDLLRNKFNNIVDIPYKQLSIENNNYNSDSMDNNININNSNKDAVINKLTQIISELRNEISQNAYKINNYDLIIKENNELKNILNNNKENLKFDSFAGNQQNIKREKSTKNFTIEIYEQLKLENCNLSKEIDRLNKELYLYSKPFISNKEVLLNIIDKSINENKENLNINLINYLLERIDTLEYQNFYLISKIDKYITTLNEYSDDLCEYIDIIEDIKNVINDIPENIIENLNEDFLIVKDTLNKKENLLSKKYNEYNEFKNNLASDDTIKYNNIFLMLGNKSIETEKINNNNEDLIKNINNKDNYIMIKINQRLIKQNKDLRDLIKDLIKNDNFKNTLFNKNIINKLQQILTIDNNNNSKNNNNEDYMSYLSICNCEDLLMMLTLQCFINENMINIQKA